MVVQLLLKLHGIAMEYGHPAIHGVWILNIMATVYIEAHCGMTTSLLHISIVMLLVTAV
jgi:hypothetical protein